MPQPREHRDIHDVIDARAVRSVFQPLVELASGRVVGYEALTRGPAGTAWESPLDLFTAARDVGRDLELDWVCQAQAYRAALAADLAPHLTLFVNMEPMAWRFDCPPDLQPVLERANGRLRVVTEMTERAIGADPSALLAATADCRAAGRGVALDDVGAEAHSLALMPFVRPDVVKLDMQLLRRPDDVHTAQVATAVAAYAESTGAVILAEGIEDARQLMAARTMGATVGQGWYFGRPAPLPVAGPNGVTRPAAGAAAPVPFPMGRSASSAGVVGDRRAAATPFSVVAAVRPVGRSTKAALMPISRHLEALAGTGEQPPVLLACFQQRRHFTPATAQRFARIAGHSPLVAALGVGLSEEPVPGVRGAHLAPGDPLQGEWNVIVVGAHHAVALVARDLGDDGPEPERRFDFTVTHDRALVIEAARTLLPWLSPARRSDAELHPDSGAPVVPRDTVILERR